MSLRFLISRVGQMILTMLIVATLVFVLFRLVPGDPAAMTLGIESSAEARAALRGAMGLDQPLAVQYGQWLGGILRGDLGTAYTQGGVPVTRILFGPVMRTLELAVYSTLLALVLAVPLGISSARRAGTWVDELSRVFAMTAFSVPTFWFGIVLILIFSNGLGLFPSGGYVSFGESPLEHVRHLVLPTLTVGLVTTGVFLRFMRAGMIEVLGEDYVKTARAKGAGERRVQYRHALRNALISFTTVVGMQFGLLIGGMVVVEVVFSWPGIGQLLVQAVLSRSYDVLQAAVLVAAAIFVTVNTIVDLLYTWLDPRVTYTSAGAS